MTSPAPARAPTADLTADPSADRPLGVRTIPAPLRLPLIDTVRGGAALMVFVFHVGFVWQGGLDRGWPAVLAAASPLSWFPQLLVRLGFLGVSLFLVLSGFCLHLPQARRGGALLLGDFFWSRLVRVVPAYVASLLLFYWLLRSYPQFGYGVPDSGDFWSHLFFLHNLHPKTLWSINGAYWSLALEVQLYLVYPLLALGARRYGAWRMAIFGVLASSAFCVVAERALPAATLAGAGWAVWLESLPAHLIEFTIGMAAAEAVTRRRTFRSSVEPVALVLASLLWIPTGYLAHELRLWPIFPADRVVVALSFGALLVLAARTPVAPKWARLLAAPGAVSYSLYLLHQPPLVGVRHLVRGWAESVIGSRSDAALWAFFALVVLPVSVLGAAVWAQLFELPFLRGGWARRALERVAGLGTKNHG